MQRVSFPSCSSRHSRACIALPCCSCSSALCIPCRKHKGKRASATTPDLSPWHGRQASCRPGAEDSRPSRRVPAAGTEPAAGTALRRKGSPAASGRQPGLSFLPMHLASPMAPTGQTRRQRRLPTRFWPSRGASGSACQTPWPGVLRLCTARSGFSASTHASASTLVLPFAFSELNAALPRPQSHAQRRMREARRPKEAGRAYQGWKNRSPARTERHCGAFLEKFLAPQDGLEPPT